MDFSKYDGNVHPDEWINDIQQYLRFKKCTEINHAIQLVDPYIKLPSEINNFEELRNALKEDISFTVFKNTNKRTLELLKYIPESEGGKTSKFISDFRKLCYNAEINEIEEQKKYFYKSLPNNDLLTDLFKRKGKINSMNDLIKEFEGIVTEKSNEKVNLITNGSIVALKHVATGKYLNSIENLCYKAGSNSQLVFAGESDQNSLWSIFFNTNSSISFHHIKSKKFLGILYYCCNSYYGYYDYGKSPLTEHTEVSCNSSAYNSYFWEFNHCLENRQGCLKSNDIINLGIKKISTNNKVEFLRSHDVQFDTGYDTFQEVVCHDKVLGRNDEWCIELIK